MNPESCFNCEYCNCESYTMPGAMYGASYENFFFGHYTRGHCSKESRVVGLLPFGLDMDLYPKVPEWCPLGYYRSTKHNHSSCKHSNNHGICLGYSRNCNLEVDNEKYCKNYEETNE